MKKSTLQHLKTTYRITGALGGVRPMLGVCPPRIPRHLWHEVAGSKMVRVVHLAIWVIAALMIGILIVSSSGLLVIGNRALAASVLFLSIVGASATILNIVCLSKSIKAFAERIYHADYEICHNCGYCLNGLGEEYLTCPECGITTTKFELRVLWQKWIPCG